MQSFVCIPSNSILNSADIKFRDSTYGLIKLHSEPSCPWGFHCLDFHFPDSKKREHPTLISLPPGFDVPQLEVRGESVAHMHQWLAHPAFNEHAMQDKFIQFNRT